MYILGINPRLNSSVALMWNNKVIFAAQEERYSKVKNQPGLPLQAIQAALDHAGITMDQVDRVFIGGKDPNFPASSEANLAKFDYDYGLIKKQWFGESSFIRFARKVKSTLASLKKAQKDHPLHAALSKTPMVEKYEEFDHHLCHAASAYYGLAPEQDEKYLIFSLDGGGDSRTSAVYIGHNNELEEIAASNSFSPASLYGHITYIMGFVPHEHEYKLMGLAAYAQPKYRDYVKDMLAKYIGFDSENPLVFTNGDKYPNLRNSQRVEKQKLVTDLMKDALNVRFDNLSAGLQAMAEDVAVKWIKTGIERTGIKKVLLTGGFFMNVKANKLIAELPEVEFVNCMPSCGDETNAFGAAFLGYNLLMRDKGENIEFGNICLGTEASFDIEEAKKKYADQVNFEQFDDINGEVVNLLMDHKIIARCSGRMEFGARALGNRSIIASPDDIRIINKINAAIKKRDFWMPFAPAVLEDQAELVIDIPDSMKTSFSPYMMFTFNAKPEMSDRIIAGVHQADKTARAQLVNKEIYPEFADIIKRFHEKSGIPSVLNTSFNLHGFPIVLGAMDAIHVYLNSALDVLIVDNYKITKK